AERADDENEPVITVQQAIPGLAIRDRDLGGILIERVHDVSSEEPETEVIWGTILLSIPARRVGCQHLPQVRRFGMIELSGRMHLSRKGHERSWRPARPFA